MRTILGRVRESRWRSRDEGRGGQRGAKGGPSATAGKGNKSACSDICTVHCSKIMRSGQRRRSGMKHQANRSAGPNGWKALVAALRSRRTVSTAELDRLVKERLAVSMDYARRRLQREGVLRRGEGERRGLWLVTSGRAGAALIDSTDAVRTVMGGEAVFGYGTALLLHGLSRYARLSECYVLSVGRRNRRRIGTYLVRFVRSPLSETVGVMAREYGGRAIRLTDLERTLIDCIHRPKYAQGWENVLHALNRVRRVDAERMLAYVKQYRVPALAAKAGLILGHFGAAWRVSDRALASLRPYLPRTPARFARDAGGKFDTRWNLYVPEGLFDE